MCPLLVDLPDISVLGVDTSGPRVRVRIETTGQPKPCGRCGAVSESKGRLRVVFVDLPVFGNPASSSGASGAEPAHRLWLVGRDRRPDRWPSPDHDFRAGRWATEQVGRHGRPVSSVAAELGCDWRTVNDTVIAYRRVLVDTAGRIGTVAALGCTRCCSSAGAPGIVSRDRPRSSMPTPASCWT